jgi:hypothetical protein
LGRLAVSLAEENRYHAELMPEIFQVADPIMTPEWFGEVLKNPHQALFVAEIKKESHSSLRLFLCFMQQGL